MSVPPPALIVAAPSSGCGKTVLTLALLRHFARCGRTVTSAKVGPDYIDPAFHTAASGAACRTLDPWAMRNETLAATIASLARGSDLIVCEGVMGLFDGATATQGSTADVAAVTGWPVLLVVDARAQAASAAAVVQGFARFRPDVRVAGVVFNRVGGARHAEVLREATRRAEPQVAIVGCVARDDRLTLPERHLGLVQAAEHPDLAAFLERAADIVAEAIDTEAVLSLAQPGKARAVADTASPPLPPLGQRIAVAEDVAFAFRYCHVADGWRQAGAEIVAFSPLANEPPDDTADAVYLPGGYPELHAGRIAANAGFLGGLRAAAARGAKIFGECGGYMVLGEGLIDGDGHRHAMAGLLPLETSFATRRLRLGYRQAQLIAAGPLGAAGGRFRGHEFHYATIIREGPGQPLFQATDAQGSALGSFGLVCDGVSGSFLHLIDRA